MKTAIPFDFPLPRPHCGMALGNGNFGVLAWGSGRLHMTLNRSDFWDRRGSQHLVPGMGYRDMLAAFRAGDREAVDRLAGLGQTCRPRGADPSADEPRPTDTLRPLENGADFRPTRLPMGRFDLAFRNGCRPKRGVVDTATGRVTVAIQNRCGRCAGSLELALHPEQPVLYVRDPGALILRVTARPAWTWVARELKRRGFKPPLRLARRRLCGWIQACPSGPAMAAVCLRLGRGLSLAMAAGNGTAEARDAALGAAEDGARENGAPLRSAGERWWRRYWRRAPVLNIPHPFLAPFWRYALYRFGCATSPGGGVPAGLQGPWVEDDQIPRWGGDYHFNVNLQQIYTLAFAAGQESHCLPLFDMIDSWMPLLRHTARILLDVEDGLWMGMLTTDRGRLLYHAPGCILDPMVSVWSAHLYWLYWVHTGDRDFLARRAFPFMAGVMRSIEAMLEDDGGRLALPMAVSPEYADRQVGRLGRNPSAQLAGIHWLAEALIEASRLLGRRPRPAWMAIRRRLPRWCLVGEPGSERIGIWEGEDLAQSHRHHSHLAGLYPFDSLGRLGAAGQGILRRSVAHWIGQGMGQWSEWGIPWAAILQARMGYREAPLALLELWRAVFVNEGWASVYAPRFRGIIEHGVPGRAPPEIMQLDGSMGAATALMEILVHQRQGLTILFPAVPEAWRETRFRGIRIPGPFRVSASLKAGRLARACISSLGGRTLTLASPRSAGLVESGRGGGRVLPFPLTLRFRPGETRIFTGAGSDSRI